MNTLNITPADNRAGRRLIQLGMILFLTGLLTGFAVPILANPRMGLASHLEGLINGIVLAILGLIWPRLRLSGAWRRTAFWLAVYGTFANWAATLLAAWWGAGAMMPIAGGGRQGTPIQEAIINVGLWSLSVAMVVVSAIIIAGLRGPDPAPTPGSD